jgi:ligand-binding sensor domain-containing protein/two-component sensor histidine kinase
MRFHLLLQLCISLSVCTLFSQNPPALEYDYQVVDLNSRYNITSITDMCFDSTGYLYIATKEGLMIWDNNRTRLINHNSNDTSSLSDNNINAIAYLGNNNFAIGTSSGLEIYNSSTGTFNKSLANNLNSNRFAGIKYLEYDGNSIIWLANEDKVLGYDLTSKAFCELRLALQENEFILNLIFDGHNIYILTSLNLYIKNGLQAEKVHLSENINAITSCAITEKEIVLLAESGMFYRFYKQNGELRSKQQLQKNITLFGSYPILPVTENEFWIVSNINQTHAIIKNDTSFYSLTLKNIGKDFYARSIILSPAGDIVLGSYNDIKIIPAKLIKSDHINYEQISKTSKKRMPKKISVKNNVIYSTNPDWKVYSQNKITGIKNVSNKIPELSSRLFMPITYVQPINDTCYLAGFASHSFPQSNFYNNLPINNRLSYFYYYNPVTDRFRIADFNVPFYDKIKNKYTYTAFNSNDSMIYFIHQNNITAHNFINNTNTSYHLDIDTIRFSNLFYSIHFDDQGNFWVASVHDYNNKTHTKKGCVLKFNRNTGKTTCYPTASLDSISFASSIVLDMETGSDGKLLLVNRYGVHVINTDNSAQKSYVAGKTLPECTYISMEADNYGRVWLGTLTNGIVVFDPQSDQYIHLQGTQNVLSNDMIVQASTQDEQNNIYFWSMEGVSYFNAGALTFNLPKPTTIISDLLMRGTSIIGNKLIKDGAQFSFAYNQNDLDFTFSALSYDQSQKNTFAYMLEGADENWIYSDTRNFASYHNLAPGNYRFLVKSKNNYGIWSDQPAELLVVITPAFWQTVWFKLLCTFIITAIIYWIYKLRLEKALAVEKIRSRLSRDLHDDLGSTLSSISILSGLMKSKLEKKPEDVAPIIDKINDSAIKMNDSLQDLVWAVKPENDSMQELLVRMEQFASSIFESKNIQFTFTGPDQITTGKLNPEFIRNVYLIFKEAVNNTAKYSNCSKATITITEKGKLFNMQVFDNGKGFDPETIQRGNGLNNMIKRAEQIGGKINITSMPGLQTGIVLECKITS